MTQLATYVDESGKFFVGKAFTPAQFKAWFKAQNLGARPYNVVGIHHTWKPNEDEYGGLRTVLAIFDWFRTSRGWPSGKGPHIWAGFVRGEPVIVVGTHPRHDGIGIAGCNGRALHIEFFKDGDRSAFTGQEQELYNFICDVVSDDGRIPKELMHRVYDNPATPRGYQPHRGINPDNPPKSCPGNRNPDDLLRRMIAAPVTLLAPPEPPPAPKPAVRFEGSRDSRNVPELRSLGADLKRGGALRTSPNLQADVLMMGPLSADVLGRSGPDWYLVAAGFSAPGLRREMGFAHKGVLTRGGKSLATIEAAQELPQVLARPARIGDGANVRQGPSTGMPILRSGPTDDVRVMGYVRGQKVGGSDVWYAVRLGYRSAKVPDEIGYVHTSVLFADTR